MRILKRLLTPKQAVYLALTAQGLQRPEIAQIFTIEARSVKDALDEARRRLGAKTLAQAVAKAIALEELILDHEGVATPPTPQPYEDDSQVAA